MKTCAAAILSLLALAAARPSNIRPRDTIVKFCTGEDYTGDCTSLTITPDECTAVPEGYVNNTGSFIPDHGVLCRITYTADTCTDHGDAFVDPDDGATTLHHFDEPGTDGLVDAGAGFTSFECQTCERC